MSNKRLALIILLVSVLILRVVVGMTFSSIVATSIWFGGTLAIVAAAVVIALVGWLVFEDTLSPLLKRFMFKTKSKR